MGRKRKFHSCKRCGRFYDDCQAQGCIDDERWAELVSWILHHGRTWRAQLRAEWMAGSDTLRWARNILGSRGLHGLDIAAKQYEGRR